MAPELFGMKPKYSFYSDIYAYGVVLWEIMTRKIPYEEVEDGELREGIKRGEREEIPQNCVIEEIIRGSWQQEADQRMNLETAMQKLNEIMQDMREQELINSSTKSVDLEEEKKVQDSEIGYTGEKRNGKKHGYGVYKYKNGDRYEGQ